MQGSMMGGDMSDMHKIREGMMGGRMMGCSGKRWWQSWRQGTVPVRRRRSPGQGKVG